MKKLFFSLLAVAAMASCSKSELAERPNIDGGDVEILAKSTALSISTRAPFEGSTIDADHNLVAKVWATTTKDVYSSALDADGKNNIPTYNGNFNGTDKMVFKNENQVGFLSTADGGKGSMYFPADKDDVYLFGLYPYDLEWTESTSAGKSSAVCKIDGKSDIMVAPQAVANKAKHQAVSPATPEYPTLAFEHMLTKLIVKVSAENDAAISAWGQITDIALTGANGGLKNQVSIACTDKVAGQPMKGSFTAPEGTPASFDFFKMDMTQTDASKQYTDTAFKSLVLDDTAVELTETATNVAYVLVAPLTADLVNTDTDFTLQVKTTNHTTAYTVNINLLDATAAAYAQSTQGKYFEITLTFKATEIQAKATVVAWENGGNGGADIQ